MMVNSWMLYSIAATASWYQPANTIASMIPRSTDVRWWMDWSHGSRIPNHKDRRANWPASRGPRLHRRHLRHAGQSVSGLSDMEVITRALSTSDLPLLAGDVVGVAIRRTYEAQASPIMALFGTRELPDFQPSATHS